MAAKVLRDNFCIQGLDLPNNIITTSPNGQLLLFKKSNDLLILLDLANATEYELVFQRPKVFYSDAEIYSLRFLPSSNVLAVLQTPMQCEFLICEVALNLETHQAEIVSKIKETKIRMDHKMRISVVDDEAGVVLVAHPIKIMPGREFDVELFHCSQYLRDEKGGKLKMSVNLACSTEMLCSDAAISRNALYIFNLLEPNKCVTILIGGAHIGKASVLVMRGDFPSRELINRIIQDFFLIYAYQPICTAQLQPELYRLKLSNFMAQKIELRLSNHVPNRKVSMCASGSDTIFLHGECLQRDCNLQRHLYRIDLLPFFSERIARIAIPSTSSASSECSIRSSQYSVTSNESIAPSATLAHEAPQQSAPESAPNAAAEQTAETPPRYEKRRSRPAEKKTIQMKNRTKSVGSLSVLSAGSSMDPTPSSTPRRAPSIHWSASMPEEGETTLQDQLRTAKEMGFDDDVIMKALKMNAATAEDFHAFANTNAMLDYLHSAQREKEPKMSLSLYEPKLGLSRSSSKNPARSASVSRASSLNLGVVPPRMTRTDSHDINRLISTLDKEQERMRHDVEGHIDRLKGRIQVLETELQNEKTGREIAEENERQLLNKFKDEQDNRKVEQEENARLRRQLSQHKTEVDHLTIENLRLQKAADDQRELSEHRRQRHEEEMKERERVSTPLPILELQELFAEQALRAELQQRNERLERENKTLKDSLNDTSASSSTLGQELCDAQRLCDRLQRKLQTAEEHIVKCCVCLESMPDLVFMPCLHVCVCDSCFTQQTMASCPTCRARLVGHSKIFLGA